MRYSVWTSDCFRKARSLISGGWWRNNEGHCRAIRGTGCKILFANVCSSLSVLTIQITNVEKLRKYFSQKYQATMDQTFFTHGYSCSSGSATNTWPSLPPSIHTVWPVVGCRYSAQIHYGGRRQVGEKERIDNSVLVTGPDSFCVFGVHVIEF